MKIISKVDVGTSIISAYFNAILMIGSSPRTSSELSRPSCQRHLYHVGPHYWSSSGPSNPHLIIGPVKETESLDFLRSVQANELKEHRSIHLNNLPVHTSNFPPNTLTRAVL